MKFESTNPKKNNFYPQLQKQQEFPTSNIDRPPNCHSPANKYPSKPSVAQKHQTQKNSRKNISINLNTKVI